MACFNRVGGKIEKMDLLLPYIGRTRANMTQDCVSSTSGFARPLLSAEQRLLWGEAIGRYAVLETIPGVILSSHDPEIRIK